MKRRLQTGLLALFAQVAVGVAARPVTAAAAELTPTPGEGGGDSFADVKAVDDSALQDERGGFITAGGITFDIGATIKTSVNGTLALQSTLHLTPAGWQQETWVNPQLPDATTIGKVTGLTSNGGANNNTKAASTNGGGSSNPASALINTISAAAGAGTSNSPAGSAGASPLINALNTASNSASDLGPGVSGVQSPTTGNATPAASPAVSSPAASTPAVSPPAVNATTIAQLSSVTGLDLSGLVGANGVVLKQTQGAIALLANVTPNALQNLVINTSNGQTISQNTNITVNLPGFDQQFSKSGTFYQITQLANLAQLSSVGH